MRTELMLCLVSATLGGAPAVAQIPNGGFEAWSDAGGFDDPDQWATNNYLSWPLATALSCEEGTPGAVGASFAKVISLDIPGIGVLPGVIFTGTVSIGVDAVDGFPYTQRPAALNGKWQYYMSPADSGVVFVDLYKWNTGTHARDEIGQGMAVIQPGSLSSWQNFSVAITYFSALDPDTATVGIVSSAGDGVAGSTIWVDELSLGAFAAVHEEMMDPGFDLYPSPATDLLHINTSEPLAEVSVLDMSGRELSRQVAGTTAAVVYVGTLPAGIYLVRVRFADDRAACRSFTTH